MTKVVTGESVSRSFPPLEPIVHAGNGLWLGSNIFIDVGHLGPRVPKQIGRGDPRAISSSRATATEVDLYALPSTRATTRWDPVNASGCLSLVRWHRTPVLVLQRQFVTKDADCGG